MRRFELPENTERYRTVGPWTNSQIPAAFRKQHSLKANIWGRLTVSNGYIDFYWDDEPDAKPFRIFRGDPFIIPPLVLHHVETVGPVTLTLSFYRNGAGD